MRPTTYTQELISKGNEYLSYFMPNGKKPAGFDEVVPTVVGLCQHINRSQTVVYDWEKHPDKEGFADILTRIREMQHIKLVNGGLAGGFNPAVTKMMLTKHGYSDKIEQDHKSSDGTMSPTRIEITAPSDDNGQG